MFSSSFCKHWQLHYSQNLKLYFGVKQEVVTSAQLTLSPPALSSPNVLSSDLSRLGNEAPGGENQGMEIVKGVGGEYGNKAGI